MSKAYKVKEVYISGIGYTSRVGIMGTVKVDLVPDGSPYPSEVTITIRTGDSSKAQTLEQMQRLLLTEASALLRVASDSLTGPVQLAHEATGPLDPQG